jgi:hypothetical protein
LTSVTREASYGRFEWRNLCGATMLQTLKPLTGPYKMFDFIPELIYLICLYMLIIVYLRLRNHIWCLIHPVFYHEEAGTSLVERSGIHCKKTGIATYPLVN